MKSAVTFICFALATSAAAADIRSIELRRLFEPTQAELAAEANNKIYIYDGLTEKDIDQAMADEFPRIEHMMFIRVKPANGNKENPGNPDTTGVARYDDGC